MIRSHIKDEKKKHTGVQAIEKIEPLNYNSYVTRDEPDKKRIFRLFPLNVRIVAKMPGGG